MNEFIMNKDYSTAASKISEKSFIIAKTTCEKLMFDEEEIRAFK